MFRGVDTPEDVQRVVKWDAGGIDYLGVDFFSEVFLGLYHDAHKNEVTTSRQSLLLCTMNAVGRELSCVSPSFAYFHALIYDRTPIWTRVTHVVMSVLAFSVSVSTMPCSYFWISTMCCYRYSSANLSYDKRRTRSPGAPPYPCPA